MGGSDEWVRIELEAGARLDRGDLNGAATVVIEGYGSQVLGVLVKTLRNRAAAREAYTVWVEELWESLKRFRRQCSFRTWSYAIANRVARRLKQEARRSWNRILDVAELQA